MVNALVEILIRTEMGTALVPHLFMTTPVVATVKYVGRKATHMVLDVLAPFLHIRIILPVMIAEKICTNTLILVSV